ncbi:MAG TPA: hypothetical protein VFK02_25140 [Kofleriaceae bacterium]|nr:hypothetical protein [Kofleriaceae bacterium]
MTAVPPAIRAVFQAALQPLSKHAAALPDPLPVGGRAIRISDPAATGSREDIHVLAGQAGAAYYLDYFRVKGDISVHGRIHEDGRVEKLENYEGQFGINVFPNPADTEREKKRVADHNTRVRDILRQKGFER